MNRFILSLNQFSMMRFFLLLLLFSLFTACQRYDQRIEHELDVIEKLVRMHPDQAMHQLASITSPESLPQADYARYALCYNEAAWHLDPRRMSDSLALFAVGYYEKKHDDYHAAEALFLMGLINKNLHNPAAASTWLKAERFAKQSANLRILGLIYWQKGILLHEQGFDSLSLIEHQKSKSVFSAMNDEKNLLVAEINIVGSFLALHQLDSAKYYAKFAEADARRLRDTVLLSTVLRFEGLAAFYQGKDREAEQWLLASLKTSHDAYDAGKYMNLGMVYAHEKRYALAQTTLLEALRHHPTGGLETACYEQLIDVAYWLHEYDQLKTYAVQYVSKSDSLNQSIIKTSLIGLERKYQFEHLNAQNQLLIIKNQRLGIIVLSVLLSLFVLLYFYVNKSLQNKKHKLQLEIDKVSLAEKERKLHKTMADKLEMYEKILSLHATPTNKPEQIGIKFQHLFDSGKIKSKEGIDDLLKSIDEVYDQFSVKLKERYPQLTPSDILICSLIRAGFENTTIVGFLGIQITSFHMRCHRIRQRMALPRQVNLEQFLIQFPSDSAAIS
ncbi:MAG: hypothetical protein ACP5F6_00680 [Microbacter sp.]